MPANSTVYSRTLRVADWHIGFVALRQYVADNCSDTRFLMLLRILDRLQWGEGVTIAIFDDIRLYYKDEEIATMWHALCTLVTDMPGYTDNSAAYAYGEARVRVRRVAARLAR